MFADIETFDLLVRRHTQPMIACDDLPEDHRNHEHKRTHTQSRPQAVPSKVPLRRQRTRPIPGGIRRKVILGEQTDADRPKNAADQVHRSGAHRIVDLDLVEETTPTTTTKKPAIRPIMSELGMLTNAQGAVIATSPAKAPLRIIDRSGLPSSIHAVIEAEIAAAAAAVLVATAIRPIAPASAAIVLPGLNPNQPNHSTKTPIVANAKLCPGIGKTLPVLAVLADARAQEHDAGQSRPTPDRVNDRRAGKVEHAKLWPANRHPRSSDR